MTPNDLLTLGMILTEPPRNTKQNILSVSYNSLFPSNYSEKTILAVILLIMVLKRQVLGQDPVKQGNQGNPLVTP